MRSAPAPDSCRARGWRSLRPVERSQRMSRARRALDSSPNTGTSGSRPGSETDGRKPGAQAPKLRVHVGRADGAHRGFPRCCLNPCCRGALCSRRGTWPGTAPVLFGAGHPSPRPPALHRPRPHCPTSRPATAGSVPRGTRPRKSHIPWCTFSRSPEPDQYFMNKPLPKCRGHPSTAEATDYYKACGRGMCTGRALGPPQEVLPAVNTGKRMRFEGHV